MSTIPAQLANVKAENGRLREAMRKLRERSIASGKLIAEQREHIALCRAKGWDELSRVLVETPAPGEEKAKRRALRRSGVAA